MRTIKTISKMRAIADAIHKKGGRIHFIPTMGFLHDGHLSLVRAARKKKGKKDTIVVSVFVNPTQFGPKEDLKDYPRDINRDKRLLVKEKTDYLFYPTVDEMYVANPQITFQFTDIMNCLCGISRPHHFPGVAQVVAKLFNIVTPQFAYFGRKDYQQSIVIKRLVSELNFPVKIVVCPIVREPSGVAMSSRNEYLTNKEREQAPILQEALREGKKLIDSGVLAPGRVISAMKRVTREAPDATVDYIDIRNADDLSPVSHISGRVLLAIAVKFSKARLIDNIVVNVRT